MLNNFMQMLSHADAVTVDDGALLSNWDVEAIDGSANAQSNEVVRFSWTDGEADFSCTLTEGGIQGGTLLPNGTFQCEDHEGSPVTIRCFQLLPVVAPEDPLTRLFDAAAALRDSESSEGCEDGLTVTGTSELCETLWAITNLKKLTEM